MTKGVLTDIASVVKAVEHFINSKSPQVIPEAQERQGFQSNRVKILHNRTCINICVDS